MLKRPDYPIPPLLLDRKIELNILELARREDKKPVDVLNSLLSKSLAFYDLDIDNCNMSWGTHEDKELNECCDDYYRNYANLATEDIDTMAYKLKRSHNEILMRLEHLGWVVWNEKKDRYDAGWPKNE